MPVQQATPQPLIRFRIDFNPSAQVGIGKIGLLEAIARSGSISQAARDLGMSYRYAWLLVESLKKTFRKPITISATGGKGGGGVTLTQFGQELVDAYRTLELDIALLTRRHLASISAAVRAPRAVRRGKPAGKYSLKRHKPSR